MNQELKQRLIGAAVITALAAIFVPMLFDEPAPEPPANQAEITAPAPPPADGKAPASADEVLKNDGREGAGAGQQAPVEDMAMDDGAVAGRSVPPESDADNVSEEEIGTDPALADDADEPAVPDADINADSEAEPAPENIGTGESRPAPSSSRAGKKAPAEAVEPVPAEPGRAEPGRAEPAAKPAASAHKPAPDLSRWYLQAGTFGRRENAEALFAKLKKLGMPVTLQTVQGGNGPLYRLRVGPELSKKRALDLKNTLQKQKIKTLLVGEGND